MSTLNTQARASKKRPYRLGRRADKLEETRRRIVEAAVDLHSTLGPARTTVKQISELAGVQRHTYYAHFPDERSLFLACSGLALARDPLPEVSLWQSLPCGRARVRHGLTELYLWYERNTAMAACVLRDAEHHALTREMAELRIVPTLVQASQMLGEGLDTGARALLGVALDFACWRVLGETHRAKLAADLMTKAVCGRL